MLEDRGDGSRESRPRGFQDLNLARKVGIFFPAFVDGLTIYVIRHHILIWKYDITAVPPFSEMIHRHHKFIFCAPG